MLAEIDAAGVLTVSAETPLEQFALRTWWELSATVLPGTLENEREFIRGSRVIVYYGPAKLIGESHAD